MCSFAYQSKNDEYDEFNNRIILHFIVDHIENWFSPNTLYTLNKVVIIIIVIL